jgi:hypothetical protein
MSGGADRWIRWTTTGCVGLLALVAGSVSYLHRHLLVESHGQPGRVAALSPLSVDGMIVAASTTLTDSLAGKRGRVLPWALLAVGSVASLAAKVAVAEPTAAGRVIAPWPSRRFGRSLTQWGLMPPQLPRLGCLATVRSLLLRACHLPMAMAVGGAAEGRTRPPLTWSTSRVGASARDLISRLATGAVAGPRRAGT